MEIVLDKKTSNIPKLSQVGVAPNSRPWAYLMYRKLTKQARERLTRKLARKGHKLVKVYQDQRGQRRVSESEV